VGGRQAGRQQHLSDACSRTLAHITAAPATTAACQLTPQQQQQSVAVRLHRQYLHSSLPLQQLTAQHCPLPPSLNPPLLRAPSQSSPPHTHTAERCGGGLWP
jgi:hypothetical protein